MTKQNQTPTPTNIKELLQKTYNENPVRLKKALEDLSKISQSDTAERAEELLRDPDKIVHEIAKGILQSPQYCENAKKKLLQKTHDERSWVKLDALRNFNDIFPSHAARRAEDLLEDPGSSIRQAALRILHSQESYQIYLEKVRPLLEDDDCIVRNYAFDFMHKVAPKEAFPYIKNRLNDIEDLLHKTHDENYLIKSESLTDLNEISQPRAAKRAEELLDDPESYGERVTYIIRLAAIRVLKSQKNCKIYLKKIRHLLKDEHYIPRLYALEFIQKAAPKEAILHAENMLEGDTTIASLAFTIIAEQNNRKAHKILIKYAETHSDLKVRLHCLSLLKKYDVPGTEQLPTY